jgi:hypothetical protein
MFLFLSLRELHGIRTVDTDCGNSEFCSEDAANFGYFQDFDKESNEEQIK